MPMLLIVPMVEFPPAILLMDQVTAAEAVNWRVPPTVTKLEVGEIVTAGVSAPANGDERRVRLISRSANEFIDKCAHLLIAELVLEMIHKARYQRTNSFTLGSWIWEGYGQI